MAFTESVGSSIAAGTVNYVNADKVIEVHVNDVGGGNGQAVATVVAGSSTATVYITDNLVSLSAAEAAAAAFVEKFGLV